MVQRQIVGTGNVVILHPGRAVAIRAGDEQTVQRRGEHGPLHREFEAAFPKLISDHLIDAELLPQAPEEQRPADATSFVSRRITVVDGIQDHGPFREPSDRGGQAIEILAGENRFLASEIADDALLRAATLADILHEVDVGVAIDGLLAHEHAELASQKPPFVKQ